MTGRRDCRQYNTLRERDGWWERKQFSFALLNTLVTKCWIQIFILASYVEMSIFLSLLILTNLSVFLVLLWLSLVFLWRLLTEDFFAFHNHSAGGFEQDTEYGNTAHLGDCHGKTESSFPSWRFVWTTFAREHYFTISLL